MTWPDTRKRGCTRVVRACRPREPRWRRDPDHVRLPRAPGALPGRRALPALQAGRPSPGEREPGARPQLPALAAPLTSRHPRSRRRLPRVRRARGPEAASHEADDRPCRRRRPPSRHPRGRAGDVPRLPRSGGRRTATVMVPVGATGWQPLLACVCMRPERQLSSATGSRERARVATPCRLAARESRRRGLVGGVV